MQVANGHHWDMQDDLVEVDPDMHAIILKEKDRQKRGGVQRFIIKHSQCADSGCAPP